MQRSILRRLFQSVLALLVLAMLSFLMSRLTGDPTTLMLPDDASREDIAQLRHALGRDQMQIFAGRLRWLPGAGVGRVWHYALPAFTLGWFVVAGMMRLVRSSMLDLMGSEFVKLARMQGVPEARVIWQHALRNACIPVLTFGAISLTVLITGAILVETVFAWPDIDQLIYQGIVLRDVPVVQAVVLLTAAIVISVHLLVDILYAYLDPRIRYG
jgi:peptide/nickel transport system permease protein